MVIPAFVIPHCPFLDTLLGHVQRDMDPAVPAPGGTHDAQLNGIQGMPGIPAGNIRQKIQGLLIDHRVVSSHPPVPVVDSFFQKLPHRLHGNGFQFKNNRTGQQSPVDFKIWIFRGCADKNQRAILHKGKQIILLGFIETMDLVNKQNRPPGIHSLQLPGLRHHLFHILFAGHRGVDLGKLSAGGVGNHPCQGGFARAGRPVENHGADLIRLDGPVKQLVLSDDMFLACHFLQRPGTHSCRQGSLLLHIVIPHIIKYI